MTIYIVTVLYNSAAELPAFLSALTMQEHKDWVLIAVDNASSDGGGDLVERAGDGRMRVVRNAGNAGFARATNQGLRAAAADGARLFLLLNNDVELTAGFLAGLLAARARLGARVLAPRIMSAADPTASWYAGGHLDHGWVFRNVHEEYDPGDALASRAVTFASGCCLLLTRDVLETVGLLDERFFVYWEDTDFCMRLNAAGVRIDYVAEPVMHHHVGASSGGEFSPGHTRVYYRSYMQLLRKHFGLLEAARTAARLVGDAMARPGRDLRQVGRMAAAMARGLFTPSRPTAALTPR